MGHLVVALVSVLLTCCPPGPLDREKVDKPRGRVSQSNVSNHLLASASSSWLKAASYAWRRTFRTNRSDVLICVDAGDRVNRVEKDRSIVSLHSSPFSLNPSLKLKSTYQNLAIYCSVFFVGRVYDK